MKITDKASELYQHMDWQDLDDGTKRVIVTADATSDPFRELVALTYEVSKNTSLSTDSVYRFTMEALGFIADQDEDATADEIQENIYSDCEPDVYTSQLTEWLNENNNHVYYLTDVLEEYQLQDGFELLRVAQSKAKEEVYTAVLEFLVNY